MTNPKLNLIPPQHLDLENICEHREIQEGILQSGDPGFLQFVPSGGAKDPITISLKYAKDRELTPGSHGVLVEYKSEEDGKNYIDLWKAELNLD